MNTTATSQAWDPKNQASRPADLTENIHRAIAWIYGAVGVVLALIAATAHERGVTVVIALVVGAIVLLHAALAAGARRRSGAAKVGSFIVGVLMLAGFPIGTIVGGLLIYNALQPWPPRHVAATTVGGVDMRDL